MTESRHFIAPSARFGLRICCCNRASLRNPQRGRNWWKVPVKNRRNSETKWITRCARPDFDIPDWNTRTLATTSSSDAHGHDDVAVAVAFVGERAHLPRGL